MEGLVLISFGLVVLLLGYLFYCLIGGENL